MPRYVVQTYRVEKRRYLVDADTPEQAEERALDGYLLPDKVVKHDEYVTHNPKLVQE